MNPFNMAREERKLKQSMLQEKTTYTVCFEPTQWRFYLRNTDGKKLLIGDACSSVEELTEGLRICEQHFDRQLWVL